MTEKEFDEWVKEVKETAKPLTEERFDQLLEPGHLGQSTYTGTHLSFSPPPEGHHNHSAETDDDMAGSSGEHSDHSDMNH
jgi:cytochrome aa3-600 menaquinol oxidase subunit 2